jgi:hypothetical protein
MASRREQVLSALFGRLQLIPLAPVKRNEALPHDLPPEEWTLGYAA